VDAGVDGVADHGNDQESDDQPEKA
jgi:hypothetical protein